MWGHKLRSGVNWLGPLSKKDVKWSLGVCDEGSDFGELNLVVTLYWFVRIYCLFKGLADGKKHVRSLMQWMLEIITLLILS
jgi:hypothetical protein